jgi:hypothetical protein
LRTIKAILINPFAAAEGVPQPFEGKSPRIDQGSGRLTGATIARVFARHDVLLIM